MRICKGINSRRRLVGDSLSPEIKTNENVRQQMQITSKEQGCSAKLCSSSEKLSRSQKGVYKLPARRALELPTQGSGYGPTSAQGDLGRTHGVTLRVLLPGGDRWVAVRSQKGPCPGLGKPLRSVTEWKALPRWVQLTEVVGSGVTNCNIKNCRRPADVSPDRFCR